MELQRRDIRAIVYYEFAGGIHAVDCYRNICSRFGKDVVSRETVENWYRRFKSGDMDLDDKPRSGRPSTVSEDEMRKAIEEDPHLNVRKLAKLFGVSHTTAWETLKRMGLIFKSNVWVPHDLTTQNK